MDSFIPKVIFKLKFRSTCCNGKFYDSDEEDAKRNERNERAKAAAEKLVTDAEHIELMRHRDLAKSDKRELQWLRSFYQMTRAKKRKKFGTE